MIGRKEGCKARTLASCFDEVRDSRRLYFVLDKVVCGLQNEKREGKHRDAAGQGPPFIRTIIITVSRGCSRLTKLGDPHEPLLQQRLVRHVPLTRSAWIHADGYNVIDGEGAGDTPMTMPDGPGPLGSVCNTDAFPSPAGTAGHIPVHRGPVSAIRLITLSSRRNWTIPTGGIHDEDAAKKTAQCARLSTQQDVRSPAQPHISDATPGIGAGY